MEQGPATSGLAAYDCTTSDGPRIAEAFIRTTVYSNPSFWIAEPIRILCAPDRIEQAHRMVQRMLDSWEKSPQWQQYQDRLTKIGFEQIRANFAQLMQQMQAYHQQRTAALNQQVAGYYARQNAQAQQVSGSGEMLTGLVTVSDPKTGSQFQIFSGPKSNDYVNGLGTKINSNISPGPDFHQLNVVPE
jgi:hypothetical protein